MADDVLQVVCAACGATNRVPKDKPLEKAKCGRCGAKLFPAGPIELNDAIFPKYVTRNSLPVVVDFWAEWCGPCKMMAPEFAKAAAEFVGKAHFAKLDTERNQMTAAQFGIRSIPTVMIFKNGKVVAQQAGAMRAPQIVEWVKAHL
jgi:thioredoxin 2